MSSWLRLDAIDIAIYRLHIRKPMMRIKTIIPITNLISKRKALHEPA